MNLDRLKAFIRLANNNPSEEEANSAARRVCKILAENDFALLQPQPQYSNAHGPIRQDKPKTWNDVKRSTEPEFRSHSTAPGPDIWEDFMRNMGRYRSGFDWNKAPHNWFGPEYVRYKPFTDEKKTRPQAMRKCIKCGLEVMTFRIDEVPYICNPCHWKEYP